MVTRHTIDMYDRRLTHWELLQRLSADLQPQSYLEVGVREGDSLRHVLDGSPVPHVTLCDTWGGESGGTGRGSNAHIREQLAMRSCTATFLDGRSQETLKTLSDQFDLVEIDGSHEYEDALVDCIEGWRLTRHVMVVDDTTYPGVAKALEEFVNDYNPACRFIFTSGSGVVVFLKE